MGLFGKSKKLKALEAKEKEDVLAAEEAQRKQREEAELQKRYDEACEFDSRVAKGENPNEVEREIASRNGEARVLDREDAQPEVAPVKEVAPVVEPEEETLVEEEPEDEEEPEIVEDEEDLDEDDDIVESKPVVEEKKPAAKKAPAKKTTTAKKEPAAKKETTKKAPAAKKETAAKKAPAKKTTTKKAEEPKKTSTKKAAESKEVVLREQEPSDTLGGKFEVFLESGGFKYRLKAVNGEALLTSEVYSTKAGALKGIDTLKSNVEADTALFHIEQDKHDKYQFQVATKQNKILGISSTYSSNAACESAIESLKTYSKSTKVVLLPDEDESEPEKVDHIEDNPNSKGKFVILIDNEKETYQFALKASNGQTLVTSKFYKSEASCKEAIEKFRRDVEEGTFYTVKDKNDMYQFRLYNKSNRLVQSGIAYDTKAKCINNIESICKIAKHVPLAD